MAGSIWFSPRQPQFGVDEAASTTANTYVTVEISCRYHLLLRSGNAGP